MARQDRAPLFEGLQRYLSRNFTAFHTPGHRGGAGLTEFSASADFLSMDLTELTDLDGEAVEAWRAEAEQLAAEFFDADQSHFLVHGATEGIQALILSIGNPGDEVIIVRDCHLSVIHGLILAGLRPVFISPGWLKNWGLPVLPPVELLEQVLTRHPKAKAVWVTHPSYAGVVSDLKPWADAAHRAGMLFMVDEAHGGYLSLIDSSFHEAHETADAWVHGAHKVMGSLTQTGFLHLKKGRIDERRVLAALGWVRSTSPSYPLLSSLDLIRRRLYQEGVQAFQRVAREASVLRRELGDTGVQMLSDEYPYRCDPMKIVLSWLPQGIGGYEAQQKLRVEHRIQAEYADRENVVFFLSPFQSDEDIKKLSVAAKSITFEGRESILQRIPPPSRTGGILAWTPREAAFRPGETVKIHESCGRVAASVVAPYPPGIPLFVHGEIIEADKIDWLKSFLAAGGDVVGLVDGQIPVLKV